MERKEVMQSPILPGTRSEGTNKDRIELVANMMDGKKVCSMWPVYNRVNLYETNSKEGLECKG